MRNFDNYVFRSHMVGKIICPNKPLTENQRGTLGSYTERFNGQGKELSTKQKITLIELQYKEIQSKKYSLSDSQKVLLSTLAFGVMNGRKTVLNSEKLTKGLEVEKDSRDILSRVTGLFLVACEERKTNKWVTGAIDIEPNEVIPDIKSSWSWESYSKILQESTNEIYLRQLDSYMDLWDKKESLLCHVLTDTPFQLIDGVIRKEDWKTHILNFEGEVIEERIQDVKDIVTNHIYSRKVLEEYCNYSSTVHIEWFHDFKEIPEERRVHMIPHSYDPSRIEQRNQSISIAREFMNTVKPINNFNKHLLK